MIPSNPEVELYCQGIFFYIKMYFFPTPENLKRMNIDLSLPPSESFRDVFRNDDETSLGRQNGYLRWRFDIKNDGDPPVIQQRCQALPRTMYTETPANVDITKKYKTHLVEYSFDRWYQPDCDHDTRVYVDRLTSTTIS